MPSKSPGKNPDKIRYFIVHVVGDLEPYLIECQSESHRNRAMRELRRRDPDREDGIYVLDVGPGDKIAIDGVAASFFQSVSSKTGLGKSTAKTRRSAGMEPD